MIELDLLIKEEFAAKKGNGMFSNLLHATCGFEMHLEMDIVVQCL